MENLISPFIDGELTRSEAEAVRVHLSACADCSREYEAMLRMSAACQQSRAAIIPAPAGFKDTVMLRISNEAKPAAEIKSAPWFRRSWKQAVAGIAAGLLLIAGTLSINSGSIVQIAENPPSVTQTDNNSPVVDNPVNNDGTNSNSDPSATQTPVTGQTNPDDPNVSADPNPGTTPAPLVFLNKNRFFTTTLLQIKVSDSRTVLQQVMSMAEAAKAQTQNLGQQVNESGSYTLIKIIVPKSAADELISGLCGLGTVTGKEVTNNDITTQFADKLSQYQTLVTQRAVSQDAAQTAVLDQRIKTLETELNDWDQKAEQETVVLWLEK